MGNKAYKLHNLKEHFFYREKQTAKVHLYMKNLKGVVKKKKTYHSKPRKQYINKNTKPNPKKLCETNMQWKNQK